MTKAPIDRLAPAVRPRGRAAGTQHWRRLLFAHAPVEVELLRSLVPAGLELDLFEGRAHVGLVPFAMEQVRPRGFPGFAALDFLETNVRTYVTRNGEPGVYFFSLEAASRLAVLAARATFSLPYFHARMEQSSLPDGTTRYHAQRTRPGKAALEVSYRVGERLGPSMPGTLQHFLLERYLLFVARRGGIFRGQVHHLPYPVHQAELLELSESLLAASHLPDMRVDTVTSVLWSPGVDVEVFALAPC